ncbi:MerR family transcriptional regulator [Aurantimonas sp. DM33-3]|uniref:MerR family transcriptional regulator n=1 Tax=Aurantimonas sp. DM33-3 TaxID=2766955 RepID=UPI0016529AC2|nr:MerR family transcriptional regulator [Aurantimonas sp. DM33-3]MBC6718657.1 MerR family transcriptional regulator [Aurantimonas sp. DM33-3]
MSDTDSYRIGDLADEFNISLRSLRFYEARGLIHPKRNGSQRIYSHADRARLQLILHFKTLGFSLLEAKEIIEVYDRPDVERSHLVSIQARLREQEQFLRMQADEIERCLHVMDETIAGVEEKIRRSASADMK